MPFNFIRPNSELLYIYLLKLLSCAEESIKYDERMLFIQRERMGIYDNKYPEKISTLNILKDSLERIIKRFSIILDIKSKIDNKKYKYQPKKDFRKGLKADVPLIYDEFYKLLIKYCQNKCKEAYKKVCSQDEMYKVNEELLLRAKRIKEILWEFLE